MTFKGGSVSRELRRLFVRPTLSRALSFQFRMEVWTARKRCLPRGRALTFLKVPKKARCACRQKFLCLACPVLDQMSTPSTWRLIFCRAASQMQDRLLPWNISQRVWRYGVSLGLWSYCTSVAQLSYPLSMSCFDSYLLLWLSVFQLQLTPVCHYHYD